MAIQSYTSPIDIKWNTDGQGNKISIPIYNEQHQVGQQCITLNQIPDYFYKVQIDGLYEIEDGIPDNTQFKVNYEMGIVTFHESHESEVITINQYGGRGIWRTSAKRIYDDTNLTLEGTSQTLQDFIDSVKKYNYEDWNSNKIYTPNKIVSYHGSTFICIKTTLNHELPTNVIYWEVLAAGFNNCKEYVGGRKYDVRDIVSYVPQRGIYICILPTDGTQSPLNATYWEEIISIKTEVDLATEKANYANEQGNYAKNQGDYALEKANLANAKASLAQEKADYAQQQGDFAKVNSDYAIDEMNKAQYSIDNVDNFYDNLRSLFVAHDAGIVINHNLNKYPLPLAITTSSGYGTGGFGDFGFGDNAVFQIGCRAEYMDLNTIRLYLDETIEGVASLTTISQTQYQVDFPSGISLAIELK